MIDDVDPVEDDPTWRPPPPLVEARDAALGEIPSTARQLAIFAAERGWDVRITYALGWPSLRERDAVRRVEPVESIAVRLSRTSPAMPNGQMRLAAVWWDKRFHNGGSRYVPMGYTAIKRTLDRFGTVREEESP